MLPGFWISRYRVTHRKITLDGAQILLLEPRKNLKMFSESHYFHFQYFSCAKPQSKKTQIDWKTPSGVFGSPLSVTKQKAPMRAFFCFQSGITGLISSVSFETTSTSIITAASIKFILVKKKTCEFCIQNQDWWIHWWRIGSRHQRWWDVILVAVSAGTHQSFELNLWVWTHHWREFFCLDIFQVAMALFVAWWTLSQLW